MLKMGGPITLRFPASLKGVAWFEIHEVWIALHRLSKVVVFFGTFECTGKGNVSNVSIWELVSFSEWYFYDYFNYSLLRRLVNHWNCQLVPKPPIFLLQPSPISPKGTGADIKMLMLPQDQPTHLPVIFRHEGGLPKYISDKSQ